MLGFVVFILVFWTASIFCYEILGPFVAAVRKYRRISKLYVCDLFSLTFLLAILGSIIGLPVLGVTAFNIPSMSMMELTGWLLGVLIVPVLAWCGRKETFWVLSDPNIFPAEKPKKASMDLIDTSHFP